MNFKSKEAFKFTSKLINIKYFNTSTNRSDNHSFNENNIDYKNYHSKLNTAIRNKHTFHSSNHKINFNELKIINSCSTDITMNIAYENLLLESNKINCPILFLWQNNKNIVIGKYQNPWKECNIQLMEKDKIQLARRKSGGGAVYQDLGNLVYSFFLPQIPEIKDFKIINHEILSNVYVKLGVQAEFSGRNDVLLENKKFSGHAFRVIPQTSLKKGVTLHHGTMLLDVNLENLTQYLNVNKLKLISKGVDSVRSRVVNLKEVYSDITPSKFFDILKTTFINYYLSRNIKVEEFIMPDIFDNEWESSSTDLVQKETLKKEFSDLNDWKWIYGTTPEFTNSLEHKFNWGLVDLSLKTENGLITQEVQLFSDCLDTLFIEIIRKSLLEVMKNNLAFNYEYSKKGVEKLLIDVKTDILKNNCISGEQIKYLDEIINILPNSV